MYQSERRWSCKHREMRPGIAVHTFTARCARIILEFPKVSTAQHEKDIIKGHGVQTERATNDKN